MDAQGLLKGEVGGVHGGEVGGEMGGEVGGEVEGVLVRAQLGVVCGVSVPWPRAREVPGGQQQDQARHHPILCRTPGS